MQQAVGSSLVVITLVSSAGFASHLLLSPQPQVTALLWLIIGSSVGMVLSGFVGRKLEGSTLQKFFAVALVAVSLFVLMWRLA